jgi:arylsulfatase A
MQRFLFWAGVLCFAATVTMGAERPNIVFVLADDLGINDLACYGRREHHTPNLDRLAREGARFTQAYVAQPICSPSRAAIMTGKAPGRLHLTTYLPGRADAASQKLLHPKIEQQLPLAEVTIAERLKAAGYASGLVGKWHLGGKGFLPTDQGFDFYYAGEANTKPSDVEGGKGEQDLTTRAIEFIEKNKERPFVLFVCHNAPHIPYTARAKRIENNKGALEPVYAAVIEELDDAVGRLVTAIDGMGLKEKTLVIFTSDNGGLHVPEGGHKVVTENGRFRAGKGYVYEGGLRVPLIARWPGRIAAGRTEERAVINTDWTPTFCKLAGVEVPKSDGVDISEVLVGKAAAEARERKFFWHFPHYDNQGGQPAGAMRAGDWKLIENYEDGGVELYNLRTDLGETNNLAKLEVARAREMKRELDGWLVAIGAQTNAVNPNFREELWRQLYVDVVPSKFNAARATGDEKEKILEWRKRMDAALKK